MEENTQNFLKKLETELKIRGFTPKTFEAYTLQTQLFLAFSKKEPDQLTEDNVKEYLAYLISDKKQKPASVALALASLKFFYTNIVKRPEILLNIKSPKLEKKLPTILSKEEIIAFLSALSNPKHKLLFELMLSSGLRVAEVVSLKVQDIDPNEKVIRVKSGKGQKDRITIISDSTLNHIKVYLELNPMVNTFLFPGKDNGHLTIKLAQKVIKQTAVRANIQKRIYCHAFRSTFATMLLEQGTDIRMIQTLLGHSNLATTERYTHISSEAIRKIKSPMDNFNKTPVEIIKNDENLEPK